MRLRCRRRQPRDRACGPPGAWIATRHSTLRHDGRLVCSTGAARSLLRGGLLHRRHLLLRSGFRGICSDLALAA